MDQSVMDRRERRRYAVRTTITIERKVNMAEFIVTKKELRTLEVYVTADSPRQAIETASKPSQLFFRKTLDASNIEREDWDVRVANS